MSIQEWVTYSKNFFFTSQPHKLAVWLAQLKAKFVFNQAREGYGINLKIWRSVNQPDIANITAPPLPQLQSSYHKVMLTWKPTPKLITCIIPCNPSLCPPTLTFW